jgi:hypothetical protein
MSGMRFNKGKARVSLMTYQGWMHYVNRMPAHHSKIGYEIVQFLYQDKPVNFLELMSTSPLGCARVLTFGAEKYAAHNWMNGLSWTECCESLLRHLVAVSLEGQVNDEESGLPHMDHVDCNLMFMAHFVTNGCQYAKFDDRSELVRCG